MIIKIAIAGCGAVGSYIARSIAPLEDVELHLFDDDIVEENNVGLSAYGSWQIDSKKVVAMEEILSDMYNIDSVVMHDGTVESPQDFGGMDLVIDCFDNVETRLHTHKIRTPTVHVGVNAEGNGEVIWDEGYSLPPNPPKRGENVICTRNAGRKIIRFTSAVASNIIEEYIDSLVDNIPGEEIKRSVLTMGDMRVIS